MFSRRPRRPLRCLRPDIVAERSTRAVFRAALRNRPRPIVSFSPFTIFFLKKGAGGGGLLAGTRRRPSWSPLARSYPELLWVTGTLLSLVRSEDSDVWQKSNHFHRSVQKKAVTRGYSVVSRTQLSWHRCRRPRPAWSKPPMKTAKRAVGPARHLGRLALLLRPKGDAQREGAINAAARGCGWRCGSACPTGLCAKGLWLALRLRLPHWSLRVATRREQTRRTRRAALPVDVIQQEIELFAAAQCPSHHGYHPLKIVKQPPPCS